MAVNFPTSPSVGQFYPSVVTGNEPQWIWNGTGWARLVNAGQAVSIFIAAGPFVDNTLVFPNFTMAQTGFTLLTYV